MKKDEKREGKETMESEDTENTHKEKSYGGTFEKFTTSASATATRRGSGKDKETTASASERGTRRGIFGWLLATLFGSGEDKETTSGIKGRITGATKGHDATVTAPTSSTGIKWLVDVDQLTRPTTAKDNVMATGSSSSVQRDSHDWVLDAFAFNHHTSNPRLLQLQDQETAAGELETREGGILRTLATGSVQTDLFHVPGVRYLEGDKRNVISVGQLAVDHGLVTVFEPPSCYVKDKKTQKIVGTGRLRSGTYVLDYLRIGQDRGGGNGEQLAEGGQGGNQHKGGGDERGGRGGGHGDDQAREGGDDQRGRGDDSSGNQHRGQSGGGDDETGVGGEGGGGDNGERDSGGSGGRDNGKGGGGMEGDEEEDEEQGEKDEDAESKDSSQAGTERGGGVGVKEKNKGGGGTEGEGNKQGQEQELEESSEVHVALFGLLRPERFQPRFPHGIYPTSEIEERIDEYLLDTGASFHVTWNEGDLREYHRDLYCHTRPPIWTLNGIYRSDSDGAGSVDVTRSGYLDGDIKIDGVLLAPNVQMNLISFGQLHCQYGVNLQMGTSFILTRPDGVEVGGGYMKPENHHYVLQYFQPGRLFANEHTFNRNIFGKDFFYRLQLPAQPNDTNLQNNEDPQSPDYMIIG